MAYVSEKDAGFRITGVSLGASSILGNLRLSIDDICEREGIQADGHNYFPARPIDNEDGRIVVAFLGLDSELDRTADSDDLEIDFTEADGDAGSLIYSNFVASGVNTTMARRVGGFSSEQTCEQEGPRSKTWLL